MESLQRHRKHKVERSVCWFLVFGGFHTVSAIPSTGSVIATLVTLAIAVVVGAILVIFTAARSSIGAATVLTVKQAFLGVTGTVTHTVLEHVSTGASSGGSIASLPRVDSKVTLAFIKLASQLIAFIVTNSIASLRVTLVQLAVSQLLLIVDHDIAWVAGAGGDVHSSRGRHVKHITVFASPFYLAETLIVPSLIGAASVATTRVVHPALIDGVHLALASIGADRTLASVARLTVRVGEASATVAAGRAGTLPANIVAAVWAGIPVGAGAEVSSVAGCAGTAILARIPSTEIHSVLAMPAGPAWLTVTLVIIE